MLEFYKKCHENPGSTHTRGGAVEENTEDHSEKE